MRVWVDPKETAVDAWGGVDDDSAAAAPSPIASVTERATAARQPVQYTDGAYLTPMAEVDGGDGDGYARIEYNCAVNRAGTLKLTARGYRWGGSAGDMRFKSLFSRAADPTDTVPFDTYERWLRFQRGEVSGFEDGDEYIRFEPTAGAVEEERARREWEDLDWATRVRIAELELVRNEPFARYRLQERGEWVAVSGTLRWKPTAFGDAERD